MKKKIETYIEELTRKPVEDHHFSPVLFARLKAAFDMGFGIKDAIELHDRGADDEKAANALFRSPWKTYKIQIHNIGKDWHRRYYAHHGNFSWLQLEHFLITHCWHFRIDETRITNKKIAESMGWLDPEDKDQRRIELAERKVINNLIKIRDERKTISIEQRHNYGKMGSFHVIRMNWEIIIPFYQMTDDNQPMTIRTRKGIRYRVISLISKVVKAFTRAFQDLLDKQRKKYLLGLVTLDQDEFKNAKDLWRSFLEAIDGPTGLLAPGRDVIPEYNYPDLTLTVKISGLDRLITSNMIDRFEKMYHRNLVVVQNYTR